VNTRIDDRAGLAAERWVGFVCAQRGRVLLLLGALTAFLAVVALPRFGVDSDHKKLIADDLEFQEVWREFAARFPTLDDSFLIVIDGESSEAVSEASTALAERLARDPEHFSDVFVPGTGPFFERQGLLFRSVAELEQFVNGLAAIQPFLAELARDPSVARLAGLVQVGLERVGHDPAFGEAWPKLMDGMRTATVSIYDEHPVRVSWEGLLLQGSSFEPEPRRLIVAEPILDFDSLLPARASWGAIHAAVEELGLGPERGIEVRVTGNPALNHEEMFGLAWDVGWAGLASFVLVLVMLFVAFRSGPLVLAAALTLLVGLIWTASFAAIAVGRLNVVSIAFAVLFVGLGVDFAIHYGSHILRRRAAGLEPIPALRSAARDVGGSLVLCTFTTAIGFLCFVPTDFRAVAELGLISGVGMLVILFLTFTLFPAFLASRPIEATRAGRDQVSRVIQGLATLWDGHPRAVVGVTLVAALLSLALAPRLRFDANVVDMRDPDTPSVRAFQDLVADPHGTPWYADAMAPDLTSAQALAKRLRSLDEVERAVTLADYVPGDQDEKLALLEEASVFLYLPEARAERAQLPVSEQVEALRELHDSLQSQSFEADSPLAASARRLRQELGRFLDRVASEESPEALLRELEQVLLGNFSGQLRRLEGALVPERISLDDLPAELVTRMQAEDGSARVQIFAHDDLSDPDALQSFVDAVRSVAPRVTGIPVHIVEFGRETAQSLREALGISAVLIAALLFGLWRRVADVLLVLGVLFVGASLCLGGMLLLSMSFNFANVIVIPLLLGVGVDGAIHLVQRWRHPLPEQTGIVEPTTARAVFLSLLTTLASFGALALSAHRGLASMGDLLVMGTALMAFSTLILLPALLRWRAPRA
jgi:hopanoid biosynthesis associated RND transporter like protein HpnN